MRFLHSIRWLAAAALVARLAPAPRAARLTLWLIGDSTMAERADTTRTPERGWGQALPRFLDTAAVAVRNHAANGRSTRSFLAEGRWDSVRTRLRPGDVVLIQFGHNDQKDQDPARYTNPYSAYRRNLERFVAETRARGATPVVLSSIVRRHFNPGGVLQDTHGAYPWVARAVAREAGVGFVDHQLLTEELVGRAGPERSKSLYVWVGEQRDDTHLSAAGADSVARLAARELRRLGGPLARHVRGVD
ncbi:MAG: rhamnogalacturonan acetylesterase [Gemmatirosa sp.]